jgi:uncharacterized coiled-coil protein SlyX
VEATIRDARTKLAGITSEYNTRLRRLANGEEPDVDIADLKREMNVLSDLITQMQTDYDAKRKKLAVLNGQLSVLQEQEAEAEELRKLAAVEAEHRQVCERIQELCDELYKLRAKEGALRQNSVWDRETIFEKLQAARKGTAGKGTNMNDYVSEIGLGPKPMEKSALRISMSDTGLDVIAVLRPVRADMGGVAPTEKDFFFWPCCHELAACGQKECLSPVI